MALQNGNPDIQDHPRISVISVSLSFPFCLDDPNWWMMMDGSSWHVESALLSSVSSPCFSLFLASHVRWWGLRPALDPTAFGSDYFLKLGLWGGATNGWPGWQPCGCFDPHPSGIPIDVLNWSVPPFWLGQMENCKSKVARTCFWIGYHWYSSMNNLYSSEKHTCKQDMDSIYV